jgi:hypothetical protein
MSWVKVGYSLLLPTSQPKTFRNRSETKATEQLVEAEASEKTVDQTTETKGIEQLAHQPKHTGQEQTNGSDDLEQRLRQQCPQRVQLLFRMRHICNPLLRMVNRLDDVGGQLFQSLGHTIFFRARLSTRSVCLSLRRNVSVGIETADCAIAFAEDAAAFFDERLDLIDQFFFVELVSRGTIGFIDELGSKLC